MKYQHDEDLINMTKETFKDNSFKEDDFPWFTLDIADDDTTKEDCVLVLGLNPAGDWLDSIREKSGQTFFYHVGGNNVECDAIIDGKKIIQEDKNKPRKWRWTYNNYYKSIFDFVVKSTGDAKWGWCNRKWNGDIEAEINSIAANKDFEKIKKSEKKIKEFYDKHKNGTTIYIGDMFYYHDTDSKRLEKMLKEPQKLKERCNDALKKHIDILENHRKTVKFVYINDAFVSKLLCGENTKTCDKIGIIPVFYGGMLSMGMDIFSKQRLINEIKSIINK